MNTAAAHEVLDFWFGAPGTPYHGKSRAEWFKKSHDFDAVIRGKFQPPFEHAEDIVAQRESMRCFESLGNADLLEWARKHAVIVERFGRFPHRNAVLGRVSTPDEIEFLRQPGAGFYGVIC